MRYPRMFEALCRLFVLVCFLSLVSGAPATQDAQHPARRCRDVRLKQEWRDMSLVHKKSYIRAVRCLQTLPAKNNSLPAKFTRFDEFVISHVAMADSIHGVAHFLPWHRQFGFLYETALRQECSYRGPAPFWDWTRDADGSKPISRSPIFDPSTGFGSDGTEGTYTPPTDDDGSVWHFFSAKGCVKNGPFASVTLHVGPDRRLTDHCLTRGILEEPVLRSLFTSSAVTGVLNHSTFGQLWQALDGRPFKPEPKLHDAGHFMIGGDMTSFYSSPNDPVFYLHHAGLDRIWWKWQQADPVNRAYQVSGSSRPPPVNGPEVTLDFPLEFPGIAPTVPVRDVMDTSRGPHCYGYL